MPDEFIKVAKDALYEVVEIDGVLLWVESPLDRQRIERVKKLAEESIKTHRDTLVKLAK